MELTARSRMYVEQLKERWKRLEERLEARLAQAGRGGDDTGFLPDFCTGWVIFNVVVVAELLAIVITVVVPRGFLTLSVWQDLLIVSLYIQWVALAGTAALCYTRRYLNRLPNLRALVFAYGLLLCVTFAVGELAVWTLYLTGRLSSARPAWYSDFHIMGLSISAIAYGLLLRFFLAKHELRQRTLSEAQARLQALKSRIRPYFVFNSLNIIASLIRTAPDRAERAIEDMAELFRMMLSEDENLVPVRNEIDVARKYLALEQLRLDNRLAVDWDVGKLPRKTVMPVLTLQPLLENAIRHGIEELPAGGILRVRLWEENECIHIRVTNPVPAVRGRHRKDSPVQSLEDIRRRLQGHYGDAARLETREENGRFEVSVVLPTRGGTL